MVLGFLNDSWMIAFMLALMLILMSGVVLLSARIFRRAMLGRLRIAERQWEQKLAEQARIHRQRLAEQTERTKGLKAELAQARKQIEDTLAQVQAPSLILQDVHRQIAPRLQEMQEIMQQFTQLSSFQITADSLATRPGHQQARLKRFSQSIALWAKTMDELADYLALDLPNLRVSASAEFENVVLQSEPMALLPVIESALEHLAELAYDKGLRLGYFINGQMPSIILGDETRLRQSLLSLLECAIEQTQHGEVTLTIDYGQPHNTIRFAVEDTRGLNLDNKPMSRSMACTQEQTAACFTGLKLSVCKRLVTLMGGQVGADYLPQRGARFWFEWPLAVYDAQPCLAASSTPITVAILLPDDGFTAKVVGQLQQLNVTLRIYSTVSGLIHAIEAGELQTAHVLSIDMVTLESFAAETPSLMACLATLPHTIAWVMTPQQQRKSAKEVLTQANRMAMLKPLKWSLFSQIVRKLTFEPIVSTEDVRDDSAAHLERKPLSLTTIRATNSPLTGVKQ